METAFVNETIFKLALNGGLLIVATILGILAYLLYKKWVNTKIKQEFADRAVLAVEQMYKDLHGDEKLAEAIAIFQQMLESQHISITTEELTGYLESAVGRFNDVFNQAKEADTVE